MADDALQEALKNLKAEFEAGHVKVRDVETINEMGRVRVCADGTIDLHTVGPRVRSLARVAHFVRSRSALKDTPLREVQSLYMESLECAFGHLLPEMVQRKLTPGQFAKEISGDPAAVKPFEASFKDLFDQIQEFWNTSGPIVHAHLEDADTLKAVYGGDVFPPFGSRVATSVGLYMDTLVLPDPLQRTASLADCAFTPVLLEQVLRHGLTALSYRDLILADVDPPLVVIAPDRFLTEEFSARLVTTSGEADALKHFQCLFGREFDDLDSVSEYTGSVDSADELLERIIQPERLLFDTDVTGNAAERLAEYLAFVQRQFKEGALPDQPGHVVMHHVVGRMLQANVVLTRAGQLGGTPIVEAPTSWQYLLWKYEYDAGRSRDILGVSTDAFVTKALQVGGSLALQLLNRVDPQALIELRKRGAMNELRTTFREGIGQISVASAATLKAVTARVSGNIESAFKRHIEEVERHRAAHTRFYGYAVGRFLGTAGLTLAAVAVANPVLSLLAAGVGVVGGIPTARDLWRRAKDLADAGRELRRTPIAILHGAARVAQKRGISSLRDRH